MADAVGFIGLGIMGRPMAKNLMDAGYELVVHNRSPEKAEELAEEGNATAAGSPREVAEACHIVITMLPDSPDVEAVVAGEGGVLVEGVRREHDVRGRAIAHGRRPDAGTAFAATYRLGALARDTGAMTDEPEVPLTGGDMTAVVATATVAGAS